MPLVVLGIVAEDFDFVARGPEKRIAIEHGFRVDVRAVLHGGKEPRTAEVLLLLAGGDTHDHHCQSKESDDCFFHFVTVLSCWLIENSTAIVVGSATAEVGVAARIRAGA